MRNGKDKLTTIYNTTIYINSDSEVQEIREWEKRLNSILQQVPSKADSLKPLVVISVQCFLSCKKK